MQLFDSADLPKGFKLFRLMGEWYVVDAKGNPFRCAPDREVAIWYARQGIRPGAPVKL